MQIIHREHYKLPMVILALFITILLSDLLYYSFNLDSLFLNFNFFMYLLSYFYLLLFSKKQLSLKYIISVFIIIKLYMFIFSFSETNYAINMFLLHETGDSVRYHIPLVTDNMHSIQDVVFYMFFAFDDFSGRLLRTIIYFEIEFLKILGFQDITVLDIGRISFLVNTLVSIITLQIVYKASYVYSYSQLFARRSTFFVALNPFFLNYTSAPLKETFIFLALALFLKFIIELNIKGKANYFILFLSFFILFFERLFMLPLLLGILVFLGNSKKLALIILVLSVIVIEMFLGLDKGLSIYFNFRENITSIGESYLRDNHGVISNFFRTIFGPAFIRPLLNENFNGNIFYILQYISYLLLYYISIKSLFYRKGLEGIVFLTLVYIFLFWPFHSTMKVTILIIFATLFMNRISFIKYKSKGENYNTFK